MLYRKETIDDILMSMLNKAESGDDQSGKANGNTESDSDSDIDEVRLQGIQPFSEKIFFNA